MNALKFQQDVLTAYMKSPDNAHTACWTRKDKDHVVLFLHGHVAALFADKDMALDPAKIKEVPGASRIVDEAWHTWNENNLLTPTEEYRFEMRNQKLRIYKARAWQTAIDQGLLKYFDTTTMRLYQMKDLGTILITEKTKGFEEPIGIVMPCRIKN